MSELARHSSITLTNDYYVHLGIGDGYDVMNAIAPVKSKATQGGRKSA